MMERPDPTRVIREWEKPFDPPAIDDAMASRYTHRQPGRRQSATSRFLHHCIAHPLLVLCPPLGRYLHGLREPD